VHKWGIILNFELKAKRVKLSFSMIATISKIKIRSLILIISISACWAEAANAQDPTWKKHVIDSTYSGADGVRIADVNGDRIPDITTGWEEEGITKVYLHPGYEWVKEIWPSVIVGNTPSVEDAVFVDINNDGAVDVVSSTEGNDKKIYIHWAPTHPPHYLEAAQWKSEVIPISDGRMQWMFAITAQIEAGDGINLVVGAKNRAAEIGWFHIANNPKDLSHWSWHPIGPAQWVMSLIAGDMDQDGDIDLLTSDRKPGPTNGVRWLENPGKKRDQNHQWKNHFIGARGLEVMFMDLADLDGDGIKDVIVTERTTQKIYFFQKLDQSGLKWKSFAIEIPEKTGKAKAIKVGDINGDGKLDLVHATNTYGEKNKAGIYWLSYPKKPTDSEWIWHDLSGLEGYKFDRIELLDLDGDGDLDVLTTEENYGLNSKGLGVIWYENPINQNN